jgi:hypothetical protein
MHKCLASVALAVLLAAPVGAHETNWCEPDEGQLVTHTITMRIISGIGCTHRLEAGPVPLLNVQLPGARTAPIALVTTTRERALGTVALRKSCLGSVDSASEYRPWSAFAQQLMAIVDHARLANTKHASYLPNSWMTLYELSRFKESAVDDRGPYVAPLAES